MKRLVALLGLMALGACDSPLEHNFPPEYLSLERDGRTFDVRVQYDPVDFAYYTRVSSPNWDLSAEDRDLVIALVTTQAGPMVCEDGAPMKLEDSMLWRLHNDSPILFLPNKLEYMLVAQCT